MSTALVTGAGQGIGRAIVRRLAADGFSVIAVDMNAESAEAVAAEVGGRAVACDVTDADAVAALATSIDELAVLVNNAGVYPAASLATIAPADFRRVFDVNVIGPLLFTQSLLPQLTASSGSVINIASMAAKVPTPGTGAYSPSKAAVVSLTKLCAVEFGGSGVRFNAVAPGGVATEGAARAAADPDREARFNDLIPLGHRASPEEIADVVAFFASPDSRYVTGQVLYVDGGLSEATVRFLQAAQKGSNRD